MKIVLMGYMGSGKSTIAKQVARRINLPLIDLDDFIVSQEEMSIASIFTSKGEIYFRLQESNYLKQILERKDDLVLALGGGTPCYSNNMEMIKSTSESFYLKAGIETLCKRLIKEKEQRPLIAALDETQLTEFVAKHLFERRNFYEQSKHIITIDAKTIEEVVTDIIVKLKA